MTDRHDALIVGSGPVGIAAAISLAERGMDVTVLEAGSAITDPPGSHYRNTAEFQRAPDSYFGAIDQYLQPLGDNASSSLPGVADSTLLGGQGSIWTNNCPRAMTFERWDAMSSDAWEKNFAQAEGMFGVLSEPTLASKTGNAVSDRLQGVLAQEGRSIRGLPLAGHVMEGGAIHFDGPWDMLQRAAPAVRDRVRIHADSRVTRLHHRQRRVTQVELKDAARYRGVLDTPVLILAGGALAIPRLLHASRIAPAALGRGFSFHALLFGQVVVDPNICPAASEPDRAPRLWIPPTPESPWHIQVLRDTCPLPATEAVDNPHCLLEFQAFLCAEFRDENAMLINEHGGIELRFSFSDVDRQQMQAMQADVCRLAANLGPWRRGCEPAWVPHGAAHLMGTCATDLYDRLGVVDGQGRVHGFDNLYLASVGLFPSPVAVNPTLTAAALALHTCDAIVG